MNSCSPLTISYLTGIDFKIINNHFIELGFRTPDSGTRLGDYLYELGFVPILFDLKGITVEQFALKYKPDRWYIQIEGHALAIVNGKIWDCSSGSNDKKITMAWQQISNPMTHINPYYYQIGRPMIKYDNQNLATEPKLMADSTPKDLTLKK